MNRINILLITYNQENLIRRTLDSILCHKEFGINNIVVNDDCSKDNTWEILKEYEAKYPNIMRIYKNKINLGIYANAWELYMHRGDADIYQFLDGDDAFCPGFFEELQHQIKNNHIDLSKSIAIYFDWKTKMPNGNEIITSQSIVKSNDHPFSHCIRGKVCFRGVSYSKSVVDEYVPPVLDRGLNLAEYTYDCQGIRLAKEKFYFPYVSTVYYAEIGVSTKLDQNTKYYNEEEIEKWKYYIETDGYAKCSKDKYWMKANLYRMRFKVKHCVTDYLKSVIYFIMGVKSYDLRPIKIAQFVFPKKRYLNRDIEI